MNCLGNGKSVECVVKGYLCQMAIVSGYARLGERAIRIHLRRLITKAIVAKALCLHPAFVCGWPSVALDTRQIPLRHLPQRQPGKGSTVVVAALLADKRTIQRRRAYMR